MTPTFGILSYVVVTIGFLVALYFRHYTSNFAKLPKVFCKQGTRLHSILTQHVTTLQRPYKPPIWCAEPRLQTIVRYFIRCPSKIVWKRQVVSAKEGGSFCIEWYQNDESSNFPDSKSRPTVLIIPGLTSTTSSNYIKSIANCLRERGFRIIVLIYRGLEGMELLTPVTYCATHTADVEQTVEIFRSEYPTANLFSIGASLGALLLGRYLGEKGEDAGITAGMLFACPFDPPECMNEMESWSNRWLMNIHVAQNLKHLYRRHSHIFESIVDNDKVENAVFIREIDRHFTAPVFGYESTDEYYTDAVLTQQRMQNITVPLLCVGANDDPFSPERALPKKEIAETENVALVMTHGGGHVSHIQEWFPFSKSYFELIMEEYFDALTR